MLSKALQVPKWLLCLNLLGHNGHFAKNAKYSNKQVSQKVCPHLVVIELTIKSMQIMHMNRCGLVEFISSFSLFFRLFLRFRGRDMHWMRGLGFLGSKDLDFLRSLSLLGLFLDWGLAFLIFLVFLRSCLLIWFSSFISMILFVFGLFGNFMLMESLIFIITGRDELINMLIFLCFEIPIIGLN